MNQQAISLGRILGISIGLDYSWFLDSAAASQVQQQVLHNALDNSSSIP